jgi:hypothetical protein
MGAEFERLEIGFWVQTVMQEIKIKLWRNDQAQAWSIEINGLLHEQVFSEIMEDLVECARIVAETSLAEASTRRPW